MRLLDLNPRWVGAGGEHVTNADGSPVPRREGVGLIFACPCGCGIECYIDLENPVDGGPPYADRPRWFRTGTDFATLTMTPSILRSRDKGGCGWHGFITNGEIVVA